MHIMEGFLPHPWWELWYIAALPVVLLGLSRLKKLVDKSPEAKSLLALSGAFIFVLSALKLPSVAGSSSHPTGTGFAAVLFGPAITSVLGVIVLLYQALLLAHGGITTLGANVFSMAIAGPAIGYGMYRMLKRLRLSSKLAVFTAAALADLSTYLVTTAQLAFAFPAAEGGMVSSFKAFGAIFAVTQVPLAIMEGVVTALLFSYLQSMRSEVLVRLSVVDPVRGD